MSSLHVLVTLISSDGVYAAVDYEGQQYFVEMADLAHIRNMIYSIPTYTLRIPIQQ